MSKNNKSCEFWGFSPSFNCFECISSLTEVTELNCLFFQAIDGRHMLSTLAQMHVPVNFYGVEQYLESYARQILFITIALDNTIDVEEKSKIFLDLYGNLYINQDTHDYLIIKIQEILLIFDQPQDQEMFNFKYLKMKEMDELEDIFRCWKSSPRKMKTNIHNTWNERLRQQFQDRFDARKNLFDWDYEFNIKPFASIIHGKIYKEWRETGIAFEFSGIEHTIPNQTLLSYQKVYTRDSRSMRLPKLASNNINATYQRNYWSDQIHGPFTTFGIKSENDTLFEIHNRQHVKHTVHVALENLEQLFTHIINNRDFILEHFTYTPVTQLNKITQSRQKTFTNYFHLIYLNTFSVHILHESTLSSLLYRQYEMATSMVPEVNDGQGVLTIELPVYYANLKHKEKHTIIQKILHFIDQRTSFTVTNHEYINNLLQKLETKEGSIDNQNVLDGILTCQ